MILYCALSNRDIHARSGRPSLGRYPSEQEEVMAAERATVRKNDPMEKSLNGIPYSDTPKID